MLFKYTGFDKKKNKKIKGVIEASTIEEAKNKLAAQNILYSSLKKSYNPFKFQLLLKRAIPSSVLASLSRDLALYIRAGIPIAVALRLAQNQYQNDKKMYSFLAALHRYLDEGKSLYVALETQPIYDIPEFFKQSIKVAESSGRLEEVLVDLASFLREQERISQQIQNALVYPLFIVTVSIFMIGFMLSYVVPKITSIFSQMHQELPTITKIVVQSGNFFQTHWLEIIFVLFVIFGFFWVLLRFNRSLALLLHRVLLKVPVFGDIVQTSELARFAYMISLLVRSGIPLVQALDLSAKTLKNLYLQDVFSQAAQKVVEGSRLSVALSSISSQIDPSFIQSLSLAEETSQMASVLQNLSQLYREKNSEKIKFLLSLLEPSLMLFVGLVVGLIVTAMLLPLFSLQIGG